VCLEEAPRAVRVRFDEGRVRGAATHTTDGPFVGGCFSHTAAAAVLWLLLICACVTMVAKMTRSAAGAADAELLRVRLARARGRGLRAWPATGCVVYVPVVYLMNTLPTAMPMPASVWSLLQGIKGAATGVGCAATR
jgi:hypothetical protein